MKTKFCLLLAAIMLTTSSMPALAQKGKKSQKGKAGFVVPQKPQLNNDGDSIAYLLGVGQAQGLKSYMQQQLHVDSAYNDAFFRGISERLAISSEEKESTAYIQGLLVGGQIEEMAKGVTKEYYADEPDKQIDKNIIAAGIYAALFGNDSTPSQQAMSQFQSKMEARKQANLDKKYGDNKRKGEAFLAENAKKEGVVCLPSGLQYKVLTQGNGEFPKSTSKVKVNYEGHLIDGTEFDSSYKRGTPTSFKANQVIKGWTEALCLMPVGSKWELYIPHNLAYGERESGKIPPFSTLIFTVELLEIEQK